LGRDSARPSIENSGVQLRWAHRLESLCFGSIFGTDISQARNEIDRDNFSDRVLIDTASVAYNPGKIGGTEGA